MTSDFLPASLLCFIVGSWQEESEFSPLPFGKSVAVEWRGEQGIVGLAGKLSQNIKKEEHVTTIPAQQQPVTLKQPQCSQISLPWKSCVQDFGHFLKVAHLNQFLVQKLCLVSIVEDGSYMSDSTHAHQLIFLNVTGN